MRAEVSLHNHSQLYTISSRLKSHPLGQGGNLADKAREYNTGDLTLDLQNQAKCQIQRHTQI